MATLTDVSSLITGLGTLGLGFYHQVATGGQAPLPAAPLPNNAFTAANQRGASTGIFSGGSTWIIVLGAGVALLVVVMLMRKK